MLPDGDKEELVDGIRDVDRVIAAEIWSDNHLGQIFKDLCMKFTHRFSGSEEARLAAEYIAERLRAFGIQNVALEPFPVVAWKRSSARLTMISPVHREFPVLALPYSPSCDREFKLIDLGLGHPSDLDRNIERIRGSAVLVDDRNPPSGPHLHRLQKYLSVVQNGAGAFLFAGNQPGMLAPTGSLAFDPCKPLDQCIPSMGIPLECAQELRYWLSQEVVSIRVEQHNTLCHTSDVNVVAEIEGGRQDSRVTLISAHYDGHDICQAANDNASGTAAAMETIRALSRIPSESRGPVRVVLFGGEETGLLGSYAYIQNHRREVNTIKFVFNLDCVGKAGKLGVLVQKAPHALRRISEWIRDIDADIDVFDHLIPFSDQFPFFLNGVPTAFCATEGNGQRSWDHTSGDTFEKVGIDSLRRVALQVSRLTARVAASDDWIVDPIPSDEVKMSLLSSGIEALMRYEQHWPF